MKILYKSLFGGWVEVTEEQKERLIKHMINGITVLSGIDKQNYINNRFMIEQ